MKKIAILLSCCFALSACKVELAPNINLSDVNSETAKTMQSKLLIEVSACNDYKDSKKESSSLIQAKQEITTVFADAKYIECYQKKMNSRAVFEIPITVGGKTSIGDIQIRNADFGGGMIIEMSKNLKEKINKASKSTLGKLVPSINITINNDLNKDQEIIAHALYLDDKAIPMKKLTVMSGEHQLKLSDVTVSSVFENGSALIYEDLDNRAPLD